GAHDAVSLRVPSALEVARSPEPVHLCGEGRDDLVDMSLLARLEPLLRETEAIVLPPQVDERGRQPRQRLAQDRVERRPKEGVDPTLGMDGDEKDACDRIE